MYDGINKRTANIQFGLIFFIAVLRTVNNPECVRFKATWIVIAESYSLAIFVRLIFSVKLCVCGRYAETGSQQKVFVAGCIDHCATVHYAARWSDDYWSQLQIRC